MPDDEKTEIETWKTKVFQLDERISELERHTSNTDKLIREYEQAHNFQIDELKEKMVELRELLHGHHLELDKVSNIEAVLREDYQFKIEKLPDNELKTHYEGLLEKLDGKASGGDLSGMESKNKVENNDKSSHSFPNDSKPPEPHQCAECWGYRMGEHIIHKNGCSKSTTTTQTEPSENDKFPKVVYQLGTDSKEYIELKKSFDELISAFLYKIRHIPLFWALNNELRDVYKKIDEIRDFYQKKLGEAKKQ